MDFRVVAIPTAVADEVRSTSRAPIYDHPATTMLATGHGPCRHCLREFEIGKENRILFTYNAFHGIDALPVPGPVFVHEKECARYDESSGFPEQSRRHALTLVAYGKGRVHKAEEHVADGRVDPVIAGFLSRHDVDYIHVHDTEAGCWDFTIARA